MPPSVPAVAGRGYHSCGQRFEEIAPRQGRLKGRLPPILAAPQGWPAMQRDVPWYVGNMVTVERVQTGVRMEKRLLKVLKAFADYHDLTLGDLLEGIVL